MGKKVTKQVEPITGSLFAEQENPLRIELPSIVSDCLSETDRFYNSTMLYYSNYEILRKLINEKKAFFVPGDVPSAKNSKRIMERYTGRSTCCNVPYTKTPSKRDGKPVTIFTCTKCGQVTRPGKAPILLDSEATERYKQERKIFYEKMGYDFVQCIKGRPLPVLLGMMFLRSTVQDFDFNNATQVVQDMLVAESILPDDNCNYVLPWPLGVIYKKGIPGVIIYPVSIEDMVSEFKVKSN